MVGQMMTPSQRVIVAAAVAALALAAPWFAYPVFLMTALCFALFACAFNLLLGYAGLMSFGHAMFFGMAGYFYGHVVKAWDMAPELGLLAGVAGAALLGLVTGALAIRRQGIYFAMITLTYGLGVGLAALAGVLAAPIQQVSALMGTNLVLVVFAVVVIGGMGSIMGSILTGFALGVVEGLTKVFYPEASNTVIFIIMAIVLLIKPAGLFGRTA